MVKEHPYSDQVNPRFQKMAGWHVIACPDYQAGLVHGFLAGRCGRYGNRGWRFMGHEVDHGRLGIAFRQIAAESADVRSPGVPGRALFLNGSGLHWQAFCGLCFYAALLLLRRVSKVEGGLGRWKKLLSRGQ